MSEATPESTAAAVVPTVQGREIAVRAPSMAIAERDGQLRSGAAGGLYVTDRRVLDTCELSVPGYRTTAVGTQHDAADTTRFVGTLQSTSDRRPDETLLLERSRQLLADGCVETFRVTSSDGEPHRLELVLTVGTDLAPLWVARSGDRGRLAVSTTVRSDGLDLRGDDGTVVELRTCGSATGEEGEVVVRSEPARLSWSLLVPPYGDAEVAVRCRVAGDPAPVVLVAGTEVPWSRPEIHSGDHRLPALVDRSLSDLAGLLMCDPVVPGGVFLAAGAPWFLTLFGRDSLWAASMLLPLGTDLALGTLRVLAARQGRGYDAATLEQPGRIPHEVRRPPTGGYASELPELYFGTVDATALWVSLLHDAWRWGLPDQQVERLLDNLEAALAWLRTDAIGGSGFVEYADHAGGSATGFGLSNQGWKDSGDAIRFADGRQARAPVALCEVQGYAYRAAMHGAAVLEHFGRPGAAGWRSWAGELADRFRGAFWVERDGHRYPALAIDADGKQVDAVSSNVFHLLGTGLLSQEESGLVAGLLTTGDLDSGFGLRTMGARTSGYNPLGYHTGSVWPHDTAIALSGLVADGHHDQAARLAEGLLRAAPSFDFRLPELFGGRADRTPLAYPAACSPQAWSAAASVAVLNAYVGLQPDVPAGEYVLRPYRGPYRADAPLTVRGLVVAGRSVDVRVDTDGRATASELPLRRVDRRSATSVSA